MVPIYGETSACLCNTELRLLPRAQRTIFICGRRFPISPYRRLIESEITLYRDVSLRTCVNKNSKPLAKLFLPALLLHKYLRCAVLLQKIWNADVFKQHGKKVLLSGTDFFYRCDLPSSPSWEPRWHSSHFLDNSRNAVGGYSNKGGTAPGHKTLKAADGRDSSGCGHVSRVREDRDK